MVSDSRRSIELLAQDVISLSQEGADWARGEGALRFIREFERHSDNPLAFEQLLFALDKRGGSTADLMLAPLAELIFVPLVVMRQHAVGHGGFHSGVMGHGRARLRWIYDCGSLRREGQARLSEEIRRLADEPAGGRRCIDLLFISHFDRDHVSGIVELMSAVDVETVIIPYFDDIQRAVALVSDIAEQRDSSADVDQQFAQVMFNPIAWLSELGAKRVIQVRPGGPGFDGSRILRYGRGEGPELPEGVGPVQPILVQQSDKSEIGVGEQSIVDAGSGWMVTHFGREFGDWCFLPYVTPALAGDLKAFEGAMSELLEPQMGETLVDAFRRKMGEEGFIARIKEAYVENELKDANAVSMSLYIGPFRDGILCRRKPLSAGQKWPDAGPGWLLTGDAKLAEVKRREDWLKFYKPLKQRIGALMLPHHGSKYNFHEDILDVIKKDRIVFACRRQKKKRRDSA